MAMEFWTRGILPVQLKCTSAQLKQHFDAIGIILQRRATGVIVSADWQIDPLVAGLVGQGCEYIARNRGRGVFVAPVVDLGLGFWVWFGFREAWKGERSVGRSRQFSFLSSSLTFHGGFRNQMFKPQLFRSEWAGWARWNGLELSYQAGNAAHPHWQFDAVESLSRTGKESNARALLRALMEEQGESELREFGPQAVDTEDVREIIEGQRISRIHFPSAHASWKSPPENAHAHVPQSLSEIESWLERTLEYSVSELRRLNF